MKLSANDIDILMHSELFHGTAETVLTKMAAGTDCEIIHYDKGDVIYSKTCFKRSLGIILDGTVKVYKESSDGHCILFNTLCRGDMFGAAALFNEEKEYVTELRAARSCRVIFFSQRLITRGIERDSRFAENYIKYLSDRVRFLNKKLFSLTGGTAEQRLSQYLLDNLCEDELRTLPLSMTQLSSELNISRASLYRAFDSLIESGVIEKSGRKIRIADTAGLERKTK